MHRFRLMLALGLFAAAYGVSAQPQGNFPTRAIEIYFPYPPGNSTDAYLRVLGQAMAKQLGVPVQVINKPGGGGVVGTAEMVRAKPDGYVIGSWTPGPAVTQVLAGATPYKLGDIQPIAGVFVTPFVLAVKGNLPANNLREFAEWAKRHGKPVIIGTYSPASVPGLIVAKIAKQDGWPYRIVSFPNPTAKELIAGDADMTTTGVEMVQGQVKSGDVRVVSTWLPDRSKVYPNVPTLKESGHGDIFLVTGLAAPAGVPKDLVAKLAAAAQKATQDPEVRAHLERLDIPAVFYGPEEMSTRIASETKWMEALMREAGLIKP